MPPKIHSMEEKTDRLDSIKIKKISALWKTMLREWKDKPQSWRKYLQKTHLIKDYCTKYSKKLFKLNTKKINNIIKKSKTLTDASQKKIMSSGKCKLKQQFYTPIRMAKTSLHTYYNGQNPDHWQHQVLVKMWSSRKVYSLLMGLQNGTAT